MKKNLRIVSAAAAALLAVAPIAASSVTANAAVTVNNAPATQNPTEAANAVTVNVDLTATAGKTTAQEAINSVKLSATGASLVGFKTTNVKILANGKELNPTDKLNANDSYQVQVSGLGFNGLVNGTNYSIAGGTVNATANANKHYSASSLASNVTFTSDAFQLTDASLTGTPYVKEGNSVVSTGAVSLKENTVSAIVNAIESKYAPAIDGTAKASWSNLTADVESSLKAAGINLNNGKFTAPANAFTVNVNVKANNGKTTSFPVLVNAYQEAANYSENPVITYNNTKYDHSQAITLKPNESFNNVAVNGTVNTKAIEDAFKAVVSSTDSNNLSVSVDTSKVNTAVAGNYPVTVTAKNPNGKSVVLTFNLTVGAKDASYKTVAQEGNVYTINGNTATKTNDTVKAGANVATFGTVTVDGVSYTRINSKTSNQFVETSVFTAETGVEKTIMHNAYYYGKDGKRVGTDKITRYNKISVVDKLVSIDGKSYYKVANKNLYINADNIDGTSRTLKHNAYIYKTSTKRANKQVLKKGTKVTTYGASYKFKNGKQYYKIGNNTDKTYVKVANFE
ncbi:MAG: SLAP domain-containing protein [Lactobacillus sp.]|nr:SLAP domain-containing protein [Lactobacillus sp.]